ncbi:hypothetical protein Hypma_007661 [Hypsizygus marmoreus]|uniref:MYND-type domain-containing protein n=1 Tax=Hypsizygus marmoreus TaxID=39966 RepID=A0A369JTP9_HYPMA|nr:hypothetical protein Hypma_007661 [Hypsizygus marmoreus]
MSDPRGRCSYCHASVGRKNVKTCGECRNVRYCSKRCQAKAWPDHKKCCTGDVRQAVAGDPVGTALLEGLTKWTNDWRDALQSWSLWAMNLHNYPEDRLATHIFVVELETRPGARSTSSKKYFRMIGGKVMTREEVLQILVEMDSPARNIEAFKNDQRGNHVIQCMIIAEGMVKFLWFGQRDALTGETVSPLDKKVDPEFADVLAKFWEPAMIDAIEKGDPSMTQDFIKSVLLKTVPGLKAIISIPKNAESSSSAQIEGVPA